MLEAAVNIPSGAFETTREIVSTGLQLKDLIVPMIVAATGGGGVVGSVMFGAKVLKRVLAKKAKKGEEVSVPADAPFPRKLDEARQQRELALASESRVPEFDAAVGRILDEQAQLYLKRGDDDQERTVIERFLREVQDRAHKLCPPSVKEYME